MVSAPNSQSGGTGFDPRQHPTCPRLTKPSSLLRSVNWYQLRLGVISQLYGHGVVSVGLLLAPFRSSFCSWSVSCKAGSGHFRCKSRYRKFGTLNFNQSFARHIRDVRPSRRLPVSRLPFTKKTFAPQDICLGTDTICLVWFSLNGKASKLDVNE